jgi:Tfp pilus assembly protein FimT
VTSRILTRGRRQTGAGLIEVLFVLALGITLAGIAAPMTADALDVCRAAL